MGREFTDENTPSKCAKVRCLHCGFTRAKNTTRQIEHLQSCQAYLQSPDASAHLQQPPQNAAGTVDPSSMAQDTTPSRGILNGTHPNPNLQVHRRGPNTNKRTRDGQLIAPHPGPPPQPHPSLAAHLLARFQGPFIQATQQPFLSHAGCGTLSASALSQWLIQDAHYARGYIRFIGNMLAKIRLPVVPNSQFHQTYRIMDLLISALNNIRREMTFFEITATKFGLQMTDEPPNQITRAYLDLFVSSTSSGASLLEGMVVLWATEHCYRAAWQYAASFTPTLSTPSTDAHIVALHQQLIPNWTSPPFSKFVDACRVLVDELANTTTSPNGKEEMQRCEQLFEHVCWLEERFWPDVDGMGEEDETARLANAPGGHSSVHGHAHSHSHGHTMSMSTGPGGPFSTPNPSTAAHTNPQYGANGVGVPGPSQQSPNLGGLDTPTRESPTASFSVGGALNGIAEAAAANAGGTGGAGS